MMRLSIYFNSVFFIFVTLCSHTRILSDAKAIDTPQSLPKTADSTKIASRSTNDAVECVALSQCDLQKLGKKQREIRPKGNLSRSSRSIECPLDKVKCPVDYILSNVTSPPAGDGETCYCTPPAYCPINSGRGLTEKIYQCDLTEICCPIEVNRPLKKTDIPGSSSNQPECGIKKGSIESKLIGSSETKFAEFPWMILILERVNNEQKVKCGGSLISPSLVLTAAHCIQNDTSSLIIRAGEYDLNLPSPANEPPHQDRRIKNISTHSAFFRKLLFNDLALIVVDEPFQYSSSVAPICLPLKDSAYSPDDTSIYDLNRCVATGWGGKTSADTTPQSILGKVNLKIIPNEQCESMLRKSSLGSRFHLHASLICAMGAPGSDTCKGDGGGPLVCPLHSNPNKYVQVGVVAGGLNCTSPFPGLYASLLLTSSAWVTEEVSLKSFFFS